MADTKPQMGFVIPPPNAGAVNPPPPGGPMPPYPMDGRQSPYPGGAPYPTPGAQPGPYPAPGTQPGPYPAPGTQPGPYPAPGSQPGPYPAPGNQPGPYPAPGNQPGPYPMDSGDAQPLYPGASPAKSYPTSPGFQPAIPAGGVPPPYQPTSYPNSPGFNASGDPLIMGQGGGDGFPKDVTFSGEDEPNAALLFSDRSIRRQFIKKVYAILMLQLTITFGFICICFFHDGLKQTFRRNETILYVSFGVSIVSLLMIVCCECARRKFPANFILLIIFTLAQSFMLAVVTTMYEVDSVLMAIGITAVVCLSLTIFAFQTKYDFTGCGAILLTFLVVFTIFGFICIFFRGETLRVVYAALGALLFSFYLIYDTQLIIGGKHKMSISPEEYIFAALNIYLDVINLFLYILSIFGKKN